MSSHDNKLHEILARHKSSKNNDFAELQRNDSKRFTSNPLTKSGFKNELEKKAREINPRGFDSKGIISMLKY